MKCQRVKNLLPEFCSGETEPKQAESLRDHLAGCPACRAEHAAYEKAFAALSGPAADIPLPRELEELRIPDPPAPQRTALHSATACCALLVAVAAGWMALHPQTGRAPEVASGSTPAPSNPAAAVSAPPATATAEEPGGGGMREARTTPAQAAVTHHGRSASVRHLPRRPTVDSHPEPADSPPMQSVDERHEQPKVILVVAHPYSPPEVEMESYDPDTGQLSYTRTGVTETGSEKLIHISWDPRDQRSGEGEPL